MTKEQFLPNEPSDVLRGFRFYCIILPEGDPYAFGFLVFRHDFVNRYVVGYTAKGSVENAKFYILTSQFEGVAGGRNVQDIVGGVTPVEYDDDGNFTKTATQIQIPKSIGYDTIYFISGAADVNEQGNDVYDKVGWADASGNYIGGAYDLTELKGVIPVMQGFWVKGVNGASAITFGLEQFSCVARCHVVNGMARTDPRARATPIGRARCPHRAAMRKKQT